jgi:hypothetical protein
MIFYILGSIWGGSLVFLIMLVACTLRKSRDQDDALENDLNLDGPTPPPESVSVRISSGDR